MADRWKIRWKVPSESDPEKEYTVLIPLDHTHFQATVVYDLLCNGARWSTCKKHYSLARRNPKKAIVAYVEERGRCIYGPEFMKGRGYVGYEVVPVIKERET